MPREDQNLSLSSQMTFDNVVERQQIVLGAKLAFMDNYENKHVYLSIRVEICIKASLRSQNNFQSCYNFNKSHLATRTWV